MAANSTFSNPVLVDEGVAFCVSLPSRQKVVAVATSALLRSLEGEKRLAAFREGAAAIHEAACRLILEGAASPVFIEPRHLRPETPEPAPGGPKESCAVLS